MRLHEVLLGLCAGIFGCVLGRAENLNINTDWLPLTDAEKQMKAPVVEKDAGVEALFWRVHVVDEFHGQDLQRALYHYMRLKVFTEAGKERLSTIDITYPDKTGILYITGRTIKADGTILNLEKDAIHKRVLDKVGKVKSKAYSFAMPGVEVGSIVEYRWKEVRDDPQVMYMRLNFQTDYPVQKVTYLVKPLASEDSGGYHMGALPFNCQPSHLKLEMNGFNSTTLENVPAFHDEPMMPGEWNVHPWMLIFYRQDEGARDPQKYWPNIGKKAYNQLKLYLKPNDEVKAAAAKAVEGASNDEDKVSRLISYVREHVRNYWDKRVTDAERAEVYKKRKNRFRTAPEILSSGIGDAEEMNTLFASMASVAGLDARPALVASRKMMYFNQGLTDIYFLPNVDMAVKLGEKWRVFDVSDRLMPARMLAWFEEGQHALIADPKAPTFIQTPLSRPADSTESRTARLKLEADGTIDGDVVQQWTGHAAYLERTDYDGESAERQQEEIKDELVKINKQAEVSAIKLENAENPELPLKLSYHIRIPSYAQRTGKRVLFQPFFFQRGDAPLFSAADRKTDVEFPYGWKETDSVTISLPEGFELEKPDAPGGMTFGDVGGYTIELKVMNGNTLICRRDLVFGDKGMILMPKANYQMVKGVFDEMRHRDTHMLSLRQKASAAGGQ